MYPKPKLGDPPVTYAPPATPIRPVPPIKQRRRIAVYAASLDPITNGHVNVIERMAPRYDELMLVIAVNPKKVKSQMFTTEEKMAMAKAAVAHIPNVTVHQCIGKYVVKFAEEKGAQDIIRGLRNSSDLIDEQGLAATNLSICPAIETIWVPCAHHLTYCSSSAVKAHMGADPNWADEVAKLVPHAVLVKLREKFTLGKARDHWDRLMSLIGYTDKEKANNAYEFLIKQYTGPERDYHNIVHIVSMLDEFERLLDKGEIEPIDLMVLGVGPEEAIAAMLFAIWYHDAVYDAKAKDNEEKSALLALTFLKNTAVSNAFRGTVLDLIKATQHSQASAEDKPLLIRLMIDLDLMILGKPEKEYWEYETNIAKEYSWVEPDAFATGRSKFLRAFLDRRAIYVTQQFHFKYETAARKNLQSAINMLIPD